ncbi:secreted RxLR effector protein 161-like [Bidens hawaiensis]|uniref:secreted RxLR effector protein 161-like n=1 Tax=Bidens hawaiensis TaxID=980011 RepID=UPI004049B397
MANPREEHVKLAKRILRYVKGTYCFGLLYERNNVKRLQVFTNTDYARDTGDRKCTSGYACILSNVAICWSSRKQEIVTLSSTEAEYVAATTCACHGVWLKGLMEELLGEAIGVMEIQCDNSSTIKLSKMEIQCDNSSTIKLSKNPVMHRRTKHIEVRFHYLRELVNRGQV